MCGIVGKFGWTAASKPTAPLLRGMTDVLRHRGPDEGGVWMGADVGLGMRRLKIMDLVGGQQPMDNTLCPASAKRGLLRLVYNGEIYDTGALRAELESAGHVFRSHSDTEVILHAFEEFGLDALEKINGMFALAVYEERTGELHVARDRMGVKPLYYRSSGSSFAFASEIKSLLLDPDTSPEWDLRALQEFFALRYVPTPRSAFRCIRKLEPGHVLTVTRDGVRNRNFWRFDPVEDRSLSLNAAVERLDALLENAVRTHLVSDVPLGVFLSGGLDSTTIAYYVNKLGRPLDSFTVYFDDHRYSERSEAAAVAERYGLRHHEYRVDGDLLPMLDHLAGVFDEPFADPSIIPTYYLCRFARRRVTVALSGDGGDELFAGYPTYLADKFSGYYACVPGRIREAVSRAAQKLPVSFTKYSFDYRLKIFTRSGGKPQPFAHYGWQEMFSKDNRGRLFTRDFARAASFADPSDSFCEAYGDAGSRRGLERMLYVDQRTHLLDEYLVKTDRLSMAHSLEVRVPLLDRALVEFAATVPMRHKLKGMTTKYLLRRLMRGKLPKQVVGAAKQGFTPPLAVWLAGPLKSWAAERLAPSEIRRTGLLNPDRPLAILNEHVARTYDNSRPLWVLLTFMMWHERYGTMGRTTRESRAACAREASAV